MGQRIKEEPKKQIPAGYTLLRTGETMATAEYMDRCSVWDLYYPKVYETQAHKNYLRMKQAIRENDHKMIEFLRLEAKQALESGKWELTKPPWPDPRFVRRGKDGEALSNFKYAEEEPEYQKAAEPYTLV